MPVKRCALALLGLAALLPRPALAAPQRGFALALDGKWLAVGSRLGAERAGRVDLLRWEEHGWVRRQTLIPAGEPGSGAQFGFALALSGGLLAVGAPGQNRVWLYRLGEDGFTLEAQLAPDPATPGVAGFGLAVAVDGERVAVAGEEPCGPEGRCGRVEVAAGPGWEDGGARAVLTPPERRAGDRFGRALDLDGERLVVGAPGAGTLDAGGAWIFRRAGETWALEQYLTPPAGAPGDQFGFAVALSGDRLAIGAPGADGPGGERNAGAVERYRLEPAGWVAAGRLPGPGAEAQFGFALSLHDDLLGVGAPAPASAAAGEVRFFRYASGLGIAAAAGGSPRDLFGFSVAVGEVRAAAGGPLGDDPEAAAGAVTHFLCLLTDARNSCQGAPLPFAP